MQFEQRVHPTNQFDPFDESQLGQSLAARFEKQVSKHPGRIAVRTPRQEVTYQALNESANRLAWSLVERRCPGNPVALLLDHGASMITAILAALKLGSIYVPLDPLYPAARLAWILEDSGAGVVITNHRHRALAAQLAKERVAFLNIDDLSSSDSARNPEYAVAPDALAYLLYTSGTTGQPKGVPQNHRTVLHEVMNYTNAAHISAEDRMLLISSFSFADAVRTLFGALLNGACLCPLDIRQEGILALAGWLRSSQVTIYRSVATAFRHFTGSLDSGNFPTVRLVYLAGEPVYSSDVELCRKHFAPECIFVNGMGSSESLTFRCFFVDRNTPIEDNKVPVGYAIPGKHVSIVDEMGNQVGAGATGEIVVRSRFMTPGYWRRPSLTRAAFIPAAHGSDERIYRTGDLGMMLEDGCLLSLGRKDFQVKIRGHRVELPEIEAVLTGLDDVEQAAVTAHGAGPGETRLVAYVVPKPARHPTASSLRQALMKLLPEYMMPASFVMLQDLPLLPNGKVNRRVLPPPDRQRPEVDNPFVEPRTRTEQALVLIWADVLGLEKVGIFDGFLEFGGDSLLAMQILSRARKVFGVELPVTLLFDSSNVADLAARVDEFLQSTVHPPGLVQ